MTAFAWRRPEWWSLALCAAAWLLMVRRHWHGISGWMLMTFAMMLPMVVDSIRATAERSLWRRRHRAIAAFLIGYLSLWIVIGVLMTKALAPKLVLSFVGVTVTCRLAGPPESRLESNRMVSWVPNAFVVLICEAQPDGMLP